MNGNIKKEKGRRGEVACVSGIVSEIEKKSVTLEKKILCSLSRTVTNKEG